MNQISIFDEQENQCLERPCELEQSIQVPENPIDKIRVEQINGRLITTSLNIAHVFGKRHDHVIRDIESLDCSDEFRKPNFGLSHYSNDLSSAPGRKYKKYEMTRDGFTFLVMGYTGKRAAQFKEGYIAKFNEMEKVLSESSKSNIITIDPARNQPEVLQLAADLSRKLEEAQPKIEFYDNVGDSSNHIGGTTAAKMLGYGRNKLYQRLRELKIFMTNNEPYQRFQDQGYFKVFPKHVEGTNRLEQTTYFTGKGIEWLHKILNKPRLVPT